MKLGIDLCSFSKTHGGGKDQVAYNLLRGFTALGKTNDLLCICWEDLVPVLQSIDPDLPVYICCGEGKKHGDWIRNLRKAVQVEKPDILLFTNKFTPRTHFTCPTAAVEHDIQYLNRELNGPWLQADSRLFKQRIKIILDFIYRDHLIAVSDYDRSMMVRCFPFAAGKVSRIYDPVVFNGSFMPRSGRENTILALNIQHRHKNTMTLVKAFTLIAGRIPHHLVCAGRHPDDIEEIRAFISGHNMQNRISLPGFLPDECLQEITKDTALFVNPSRFEGFGMVAVEMMGEGVPVLAADNSAQKEVTMGLCRYYSPAEDPEALAEAMLEVLSVPASQEELAEASRIMREKYDYIRTAGTYWAYLEEIVGGRNHV